MDHVGTILGVLLRVAAALATTTAMAQVQIDKHRAVPAGETTVRIENAFGRIAVTAWDKSEVWVKGTLAAGAEGLDMDSGPSDDWDEDEEGYRKKKTGTEVEIQVAVPDTWSFDSDDDTDYRSSLDVSVPRNARVEITSINAPITVSGTSGSVSIETVNGAVKVQGGGHQVELESLTGDVEYTGRAAEVGAETVSGGIRLELQSARVQARTVKGPVSIRAKTLSELEVETTAGNVTIEGGSGAEGSWSIETFSGAVSLVFPGGPSGHFRLKTAEGQITSNIGPKPRRPERFQPFRVLEFRVGSTETEIEVETYSGAITLKAGEVPSAASP
jgi:hypothetical protein